MSGPDQSDDAKGFLARWSQRKQEAKQPEPKPDAPAAEAAIPSGPNAAGDAAEEFDLSSLPRLEDLTGTTDITAFLRNGVPENLRNEALRKSWALDPAIRNYVNPALEYAYDWNTPGGVPGTSELGAGIDVARLVSQIMSDGPAEPRTTTVDDPANVAANNLASQSDHKHDASQKPGQDVPTQALRLSDSAGSLPDDALDVKDSRTEAAQVPQSEAAVPAAPQQAVRRHGSAKPTI